MREGLKPLRSLPLLYANQVSSSGQHLHEVLQRRINVERNVLLCSCGVRGLLFKAAPCGNGEHECSSELKGRAPQRAHIRAGTRRIDANTKIPFHGNTFIYSNENLMNSKKNLPLLGAASRSS